MEHRVVRASHTFPAVAAAVLAAAGPAWALVNPELQPSHLAALYKAVLGGRITRVDVDKGEVAFQVTHTCQGPFAPKQVTVKVVAENGQESLLDDCDEGDVVVAFVGKSRRRHENELLVYARRRWHQGEVVDAADPAAWKVIEALGDEMAGTFNGAPEQLLAMMADASEGRYWFPPLPLVKFKDDLPAGTLGGAIGGVAMYDLDGDGRLDLYACCDKGDRAYLQTAPLKFEDATGRLGLEGLASPSCSLADVNGDGAPDLLTGGAIRLGSKEGFRRSDLLPGGANERVKSAAFLELNGDGWPDVVVSRVGGGLAAYLNPAAKGGAFIDVTRAAGLDRPECGAAQTGFFAPGDWNGDGRTDLYYGVLKGLLLIQDEKGAFAPLPHKVGFDYKAAGTSEPGLTGAGGFAPLWRTDRFDLVAPGEMHLTIVTDRGRGPEDVAGLGNESRIAGVNQLATLAEDLNVDGHVDLLTVGRAADAAATFHCNRGYGSYMKSDLYAGAMGYDPFPGQSFRTGCGGVVAGDLDGDGAPDLVFGGADGRLRVAINDAFAHVLRQPRQHPTPMDKTLQQTRVLTVRVAGRLGVMGALVRLADETGRVVALRRIGSQVLTGCRGPDAVHLAVRRPGPHALTVRFADGHVQAWPVDLAADGPRQVVIQAARK